MGERDIHNIHPIYRHIVDVCKIHNLSFTAKVDSTRFHTAIEFTDKGFVHPPTSSDWDSNPQVICPDVIILYQGNVIGVVEYEEETGGRKTGAKMSTKGHGHHGDYDTKKDSRRNGYYERSKIPLHRVWESHYKRSDVWRIALSEFVFSLFRKTLNDSMKLWTGIPNLE